MVHIRLTPPVVVVERMHLEFFGSSGWEIQHVEYGMVVCFSDERFEVVAVGCVESGADEGHRGEPTPVGPATIRHERGHEAQQADAR
jgi:hypothetical protein